MWEHLPLGHGVLSSPKREPQDVTCEGGLPGQFGEAHHTYPPAAKHPRGAWCSKGAEGVALRTAVVARPSLVHATSCRHR